MSPEDRIREEVYMRLNVLGERRHFKNRLAVMIVWLAASCVLALAGCSDASNPRDSSETASPVDAPEPDSDGAGETTDSGVPPPPDSGNPDEAAAPVVMPPDAWRPPMPTEADILAHRLLQEEDVLLVDAIERDELGGEIGRVLAQIRTAYPEVAAITAQERHVFGVLLLGLEPELFGIVSALLEGQSEAVTLRTGYVAFDSLNEQLGLSAVIRTFPILGIVTFYFDAYLNVDAAAQAYSTVEGVEFAEPDSYVGDGSDVAVKKSAGRWYVVFRRAWGDCPAGCINEEFDFFIVDEAEVERVAPAQALGITEFRDLVMGW